MECYSEQIMAIAADGELEAEETLRLRDHLATCRRCRQLLDALRAENHVLSESLQELSEEVATPMLFPRSPSSVGWGEVAVAVGVLLLVLGLVTAKLIEVVLRTMLVRVRFDKLVEKAGLDKALLRIGLRQQLNIFLP